MNARKGLISVLALLFLALFATMGLAYATFSDSNQARSRNCVVGQSALFQAEGGLTFLINVIRQTGLGTSSSGTAMMDTLAGNLRAKLEGKPNLNGALIGHTAGSSVITVPQIKLDGNGRKFEATITLCAANNRRVQVLVKGYDGSFAREVSVEMEAGAKASAFDFGIASRSAISMTGNAAVRGLNDVSEANIISSTTSTDEAYDLTGNVNLAGDISSTNPDAYVAMTGLVTIGGHTGAAAAAHIHIPVPEVDFPEVDPTVFEPFATNIVNSTTSTSGIKTFTNIRIKANTNPTFAGIIALKGIVFIETPNRVTFTGNLNLTGLIVTQDAGDNVYTTNTINFTGNTTMAGVETLPDTADFHVLRTMPGSAILAPGFGVKFTGNFGTVNGTMAADAFTFTGNAGGTIHGNLINYSDSTFSLTGNSQLTIDRSAGKAPPPGFSSVATLLTGKPDTYVEY